MLVKTLSTQVSAIARVMNSFLIGFFNGSRVELVVVVDGRRRRSGAGCAAAGRRRGSRAACGCRCRWGSTPGYFCDHHD